MTNLLLSMLDKSGVPAETLGDSTGRLELEPLSESSVVRRHGHGDAAIASWRPARRDARRARVLRRLSSSWSPRSGRDPLARRGQDRRHAGSARAAEQQVDVNAAEPDGTTALHWAVQRDDLETRRRCCFAPGANVKAANRYGVTPLYLACTNGNAAIIERLLTAGADANTALPEGETALMTAARTGNVAAVKAAARARRRRQRDGEAGRGRPR